MSSSPRQTPPEDQLREALQKTGCGHLKVTGRDELVKDIAGLHLNLSAIAKGFGVDEMARVLHFPKDETELHRSFTAVGAKLFIVD